MDTFPDNEHNSWMLQKSLHLPDQSYILVTAEPDDVGYSSFVFMLKFEHGGEITAPLVYAQGREGKYFLLCSDAGFEGELPASLTW